MATKSILKNIHIKDKNTAERLVSALENATGKHSTPPSYSRSYTDVSREEMRKMFGAKN